MRVTVFSVERLNSSRSGNPRFLVRTDKGNFGTESDSGVNYMIENGWRGKDSREADITLTRSNHISYLSYMDGDN